MGDDHTLELTQSLDGPAAARAFTARHLEGLAGDLCFDALLMVSELVTNVVRHGSLPARLTVQVGTDRVRVSVFDSGGGFSHLVPTTSSVTAAGGRGLIIVAALARSWGVANEASDRGKSVWFDLSIAE